MPEQTLKQKTAKGLFWGGVSNGLQQALGVVFGIILLKNLTPADYGMVGMLAIFTGIANTIQESGFTAALTNRPVFNPKDYNSVFWFNLFVGSLFYVILFFCAPLIAEYYHKPDLILLSRILFLSIIAGSFGIAHNAVLFRDLMVKERAKIDGFSTLISGIVGVYMALNGWGYWALAVQTLCNSLVGTVLRWFFSSWRPTFSFDITPIKEMFGFSSKMLLSTIIGQIHINLYSIILGRFYNTMDVGYYGQGSKWASMGTQVINGSVNGISQPLFINVRDNNERLKGVFRKMLRFISFVSFPLLLGFAFISRDFITLINPEFLPSVPILQLYCISGCFLLFHTLYSQLVIVLNRPNIFLYGTLICAILQIIVIFLIYPYGMYWMAFANVSVFFLFMIFYSLIINRLINFSILFMMKDILPYLVIVLFCMGLTAIVLSYLDLNSGMSMTLKILLIGSFYVLIMWRSNAVIFKDLLKYIYKK